MRQKWWGSLNPHSTTKIFENCFLNKYGTLKKQTSWTLPANNNMALRKLKNIITSSRLLQSLILRATDQNYFAIMASFDLSAALNLVNVLLLTKRQRIMCLQMDFINFIRIWLTDRNFYVKVGCSCVILLTQELYKVQCLGLFSMLSVSCPFLI